MPQFNLDAQATYQSEVTEVPIPNLDINSLNNDQYRATLTANQLLYNGGRIKASQELQNSSTKENNKKLKSICTIETTGQPTLFFHSFNRRPNALAKRQKRTIKQHVERGEIGCEKWGAPTHFR
ncbi:hypothetical protein Q2T40_02395 [Winogradskyella maritima]|nr:hypothetical protein [Winogradskyella maritima]